MGTAGDEVEVGSSVDAENYESNEKQTLPKDNLYVLLCHMRLRPLFYCERYFETKMNWGKCKISPSGTLTGF